jgi:hypothetical protein
MGLASAEATSSYAAGVSHVGVSTTADGCSEGASVLIERIMDWAEANPDFNTDFVEKLADDLEAKGRLTQRQIDSLHNIIEKWRVD